MGKLIQKLIACFNIMKSRQYLLFSTNTDDPMDGEMVIYIKKEKLMEVLRVINLTTMVQKKDIIGEEKITVCRN